MGAKVHSTDAIFKVNIVSHFILIKEFVPAMLKAKKGHVVTIASMASFISAPGLVDYCCTKVAALYLNDGESVFTLSRGLICFLALVTNNHVFLNHRSACRIT